MKRFILFSGSTYYPIGGWDDKAGEYDSLEEAEEAGLADNDDWFHVVDTTTGLEVVSRSKNFRTGEWS